MKIHHWTNRFCRTLPRSVSENQRQQHENRFIPHTRPAPPGFVSNIFYRSEIYYQYKFVLFDPRIYNYLEPASLYNQHNKTYLRLMAILLCLTVWVGPCPKIPPTISDSYDSNPISTSGLNDTIVFPCLNVNN